MITEPDQVDGGSDRSSSREPNASTSADFKLRELKLREKEFELKEREFASRRWAVPIFVAFIGGASAFIANSLLSAQARAKEEQLAKQAQSAFDLESRKFCHGVITELLSRRSQQDANAYLAELTAVVSAIDLRQYCNGDLRELADLYRPTPSSSRTTVAGSGAGTRVPMKNPEEARPPGQPTTAAAVSASAPSPSQQAPVVAAPRCQRITAIQDLGWKSGHKTKFCISRGFDGVHNPYDSYSSGGFCFTGPADACISAIASQLGR